MLMKYYCLLTKGGLMDYKKKIAELLSKNSNTITTDVLCKEITTGAIDGYSKEWNINGETVTLFVKKV